MFSLSHCFISLFTDRTTHHQASLLLVPICITIHSISIFSQHSSMTSWSWHEHGFGPEMWHQQSPDFEANFQLKGKSDFSSMCEVRSYAPKQTVMWTRCSHGEFCVMEVYEEWNNSVRHFWHYPYTWVSNIHEIGSSSFFGLLTFSCLLQYSTQTENYNFLQWVNPLASCPYQQSSDYLEDFVIYNLKREMSKALASLDPSSSAGDG
jgi:hypothetical protein